MIQLENLESLIARITDEIVAKLVLEVEEKCCSNSMRDAISCGGVRLGLRAELSSSAREMAGYIDHTLLKPNATLPDIEKLCREASEYGFASVCINPGWVSIAHKQLACTNVAVCTVIGFPLGANTTDVKVYETRRAIFDGATEVDMVLAIGALKSGNHKYVENDIHQVAAAAHEHGALCKVILETDLLSSEEKVTACLLAKSAGADFVKTSTGFSKGGATIEDIHLMRSIVGESMGVKASGGVKDFTSAHKMIEAGASRIGASVGVKIVQGINEPNSQTSTGSY